MDARAGADVEDVVGLADRFLVMFDDDHRVALVAQVLQRREQPVIVALVQADGGFVEHVEHAGQARADLGGQPDALASPPDSVPALRLRVRYSSPTLLRKPSRSRISFRIARAISFFCGLSVAGTPSHQSSASRIDISTTWPTCRPAIFTASASGRRR
jgi:hypothetical protein